MMEFMCIPVVRNTFRLFGDDRVILISDSMCAAGMEDGNYTLGGQDVIVNGALATLADGTIAGSVTNLFDCMKKSSFNGDFERIGHQSRDYQSSKKYWDRYGCWFLRSRKTSGCVNIRSRFEFTLCNPGRKNIRRIEGKKRFWPIMQAWLECPITKNIYKIKKDFCKIDECELQVRV